MEKVQSALSELRKQGEDTSATIKLLYENLARLDQIFDEMERRRAAQTPTTTTPTSPSDRIVTVMSEPANDADGSDAAATSIEETWIGIGHREDHGPAAARVTSVPASPPAATTQAPASPSVLVTPAAASDATGDLPLVSPTRCSTYCGTVYATSPITEDMEPEAAAIYHVHTADVSVSEQGLAGYTALYCLSIQICSGDVPLPAPAAASASSTTVQSNFMTGAPTTCLSGCRELHTALPLTTTTSTAVLRPPGKPPDSWGVLEVADSQKYDDCLATEIFVGDLFVVRSPWPPPLWNSSPGVDSKLQFLTLQLITSKTKPIGVQFQLCYLCNAAMNYNASSCARFDCLALPWDPGDETTKWNGRPDQLLWYKAIHNGIRSACQFLDRPDPFLPWDPGDHTECFHVRARLSAVHALFSLTAIPWITHRIISLDVQSENSALHSLLCHPNASLLHEAPCLLLDTQGHKTSLLCWTGCWPVILSAVLIHYRSTMATSTYLLSSWGVIVVALMTVNVDALLSFDHAPWDPGGVQLQRHPNAAMPHLCLARDNVILLVCYSLTRPNFISPCWWKHLIGALQWLTQIEIQKIDASSLMPGWPVTVHITQQVMIRLTKTSGMLHHPIYLNSTLNLSLLMPRTYSVQPMVKKADDACSTCLEVPQRLLLHFLLLANKMLRRTPQLKILNSHGEAVDDPWGQGSQKEGVMSYTRPSWSTKTRFRCYFALVGPACKGVQGESRLYMPILCTHRGVN